MVRSETAALARRTGAGSWAFFVVGLCMLLVSPASADVPAQIAVQGRLYTEGDVPVTATQDLVVRLFAEPEAVTELHEEIFWKVPVNPFTGEFAIHLGSVEPLALGLFDQYDVVYVQMMVGGTVLDPGDGGLAQMTSVPYAAKSRFSDEAHRALAVEALAEPPGPCQPESSGRTYLNTAEGRIEYCVGNEWETSKGMQTVAGQWGTLDAGNPALIYWKSPRANAVVKLTLIGDRYNRAHYTELRAHKHSASASNASASHKHTGTTASVNLAHSHTVGSHKHSLSLSSGAGGGHSHDLWTNGLANPSATAGVWIDQQYVPKAGWDGGWVKTAASHTHSVSGSTANAASTTNSKLGGHTHSFTTGNQSATHTHTVTTLDAGTVTSAEPSTNEKTYLNSLTLKIDGVDRTTDILALAAANYPGDFASLGDGSAEHRLNSRSVETAGAGTGELDISSLVSGAGYHLIQAEQAGTAGGRLHWFLQVH